MGHTGARSGRYIRPHITCRSLFFRRERAPQRKPGTVAGIFVLRVDDKVMQLGASYSSVSRLADKTSHLWSLNTVSCSNKNIRQ